jgi:4'-phosphopantetheinyl transferase
MVRRGDRARWGVARASLRIVLAKYLQTDPRLLSFDTESTGKPRLANDAADIQFSISHSDSLAMIAVGQGMGIGIDIERFREVRQMEAIMDDFFSVQERAYLRSSEGERRTRAFFLLWTRREAAAKAMGIGLFEAFSRLALPPHDADESGFRVELAGGPADRPVGWWIRDMSPSPDFAGALCTEHMNADPDLYALQL